MDSLEQVDSSENPAVEMVRSYSPLELFLVHLRVQISNVKLSPSYMI
jgi:hypothetical protein